MSHSLSMLYSHTRLESCEITYLIAGRMISCHPNTPVSCGSVVLLLASSLVETLYIIYTGLATSVIVVLLEGY